MSSTRGATVAWEQIVGHLVHKLGDGGQGEGVLDVVVVEGQVLADHQSDRQVGAAPRGREERSLAGPESFRFTENWKVSESEIQCWCQRFQWTGGWSVLTNLELKRHLINHLFAIHYFYNNEYVSNLFKNLGQCFMVCCDHCSIVVLQVLVNNRSTFPHAESRDSLSVWCGLRAGNRRICFVSVDSLEHDNDCTNDDSDP